jgi:N-acetylneuraminic acid mutarotase
LIYVYNFFCKQRYNVGSKKWHQLAPMQNPRQFAAASNLNGKLFVTGGCDVYLEATDSVEYYAPELDKWLEVAPMNEKRARHGCKVINGSLYAFGGYNRFEAIKVIERYDEVANKWFTVGFIS